MEALARRGRLRLQTPRSDFAHFSPQIPRCRRLQSCRPLVLQAAARIRSFDTASSSQQGSTHGRHERLGLRLRPCAEFSQKPADLTAGKSGPFSSFDNFTELLTTLFPVWVCIGAVVGVSRPQTLAWFKPQMFTVSLGFLMLSMGLTLTIDNFRECISRPKPILLGYAAQYIVKPFLGFLIAKVLNLQPALAVGLILVSCCPGGQASNVATYIAHGDVALSVLMTTASTLGAIIMTPMLTGLLAGTLVPVDAKGLAISTLQVVLVPTLFGVAVNELAPGLVRRIKRVLPLIGVALTTLLCASPVAQVSDLLRSEGGALLGPVALLHVAAFGMGYVLSKLVGFNEKTARTVSIETGMQSAALGFLLAREHFADPLVAVPSAVSVVFMALGGSGLAVYWRNKPTASTELNPAAA